jgi:hypothetical protein
MPTSDDQQLLARLRLTLIPQRLEGRQAGQKQCFHGLEIQPLWQSANITALYHHRLPGGTQTIDEQHAKYTIPYFPAGDASTGFADNAREIETGCRRKVQLSQPPQHT